MSDNADNILVSERIVANLKLNNFFDHQPPVIEFVDGFVAEDIEMSGYSHRFIIQRVVDGVLFAGPWTNSGRFNIDENQSDELNIECIRVRCVNYGDFEDFYQEY